MEAWSLRSCVRIPAITRLSASKCLCPEDLHLFRSFLASTRKLPQRPLFSQNHQTMKSLYLYVTAVLTVAVHRSVIDLPNHRINTRRSKLIISHTHNLAPLHRSSNSETSPRLLPQSHASHQAFSPHPNLHRIKQMDSIPHQPT